MKRKLDVGRERRRRKNEKKIKRGVWKEEE